MDLLSDISSVSSHGSMPPLIDAFGRIIVDEDQDTITMMETDLVPGSPISTYGPMPPLIDEFDNIIYDDDDLSDYRFYRPAPIEIPQNTHLYFDDEGEEISREQYLMKMDSEEQEQERKEQEEEEDDHEFGIRTPKISHKFTMRHPRVVLNFLRFIDTYNEIAEADEIFMLPAIPKKVCDSILSHTSMTNTPPEFESDVNELKLRLERHMDLSELPQ
jgi:hypothetical protein